MDSQKVVTPVNPKGQPTYNHLVTFKSCGKGLHQAVGEIGMIAERRHTAIAIYTNGIAYLKALDAGEKRLSLSRSWLSRNPLSQHFSTLLTI